VLNVFERGVYEHYSGLSRSIEPAPNRRIDVVIPEGVANDDQLIRRRQEIVEASKHRKEWSVTPELPALAEDNGKSRGSSRSVIPRINLDRLL